MLVGRPYYFVTESNLIKLTGDRSRRGIEGHVRPIDQEFHDNYWFWMLNQEIMPHPCGARQQ